MAENWRTSSVRREQRRLHEDSKTTSCKERDRRVQAASRKSRSGTSGDPALCSHLAVKEHASTSARQHGYRRRLEGAVQGLSGDPALCSHLAAKEHASTSARQDGYRRRLEGAVQGFSGDPALCSHLVVKKGRILLPDRRVQAASRRSRSGTQWRPCPL